jgi:hypothetical protein
MAEVRRIRPLKGKGPVALNKCEKKDLVAYCDERGIRNTTKTTKDELVRLLENWKTREAARIKRAREAMDNMQADLGANLDDAQDNEGDENGDDDDNDEQKSDADDSDDSDNNADNGRARGGVHVNVNVNVRA